VYYIRDNGVGFEQSKASVLFEPFKRLYTDKEFEGSGIGLTIVKRVIELHKGRVWAEGVVDKGATFYFTIGT
jgi:light-regulated signal transduction histidine kinase (bacteriophytochrome)